MEGDDPKPVGGSKEGDVLMEGNIIMRGKGGTAALTEKEFTTNFSKPETYPISDFVGVSLHPQKTAFIIHYVETNYKKKTCNKRELVISCKDKEDPKNWENAINVALHGPDYATKKSNIIVLINPVSGRKKSPSIYKSKVEPLLLLAPHLKVTVVLTEYAGHAHDIAHSFDVNVVDCLICCGGDGMFHEMLNGIMTRKDWEIARQTPLGLIPCGSGNSMANSLNQFNAVSSAQAIIYGRTRPVDLMTVDLGEDFRFAYVSVQWAITADIDIESEKYRWMGDARFTVVALQRMAGLRKYKVRLWYLPVEEEEIQKLPEVCEAKCPCSVRNESIQRIRLKDEASDEVLPQFEGPLKQMEPQEKRNILPRVTPERDDSWQFVDEETVFFVVSNCRDMTDDFVASPYAHLSDGCMDLIMSEGVPPKSQLLGLFLKVGSGEHVKDRCIRYRKIKAYELEIVDEKKAGIVDVDGELVPSLSHFVEIHPGLLNMISNK